MADVIEHKGKSIVFLDWTNVETTEDAVRRIDAGQKLIASQPLNSVRTLTFVEGSRFDRERIEKVKAMILANKPYVKCGAIVGLSGLIKAVFNTLMQVTGRNIRRFDSLEEAKDWLAEQD